jgi:hypothetical protein
MSGNVGIGFDGGIVAGTANPFPIRDTPQISGGYSGVRVQSAATTNGTSVKISAGQVYSIAVGNNGASAAYLKLYNKLSVPVVGTDTPVATYLVPAGGNFVTSFRAGKPFTVGIAYAITGAAADNDTTGVAANQVIGSIEYA